MLKQMLFFGALIILFGVLVLRDGVMAGDTYQADSGTSGGMMTKQTVQDPQQVSETASDDGEQADTGSVNQTETRTAAQAMTSETQVTQEQEVLQVTTQTSGDVQHIEYYSQNRQTETEMYLGTGRKESPEQWNLNIDPDKRLPNGEYRVTPRIRQRNGDIVQGKPTQVRIEASEEGLTSIEKVRFEHSAADTDGDGIIDREEIRLNINPKLADTDRDGFLDGDEIKNGFDPLKFSVGDKSDRIVFESPKDVAVKMKENPASEKINDERFVVDKIERVHVADGKAVTRFSGKALPDIFVTVYIYSDPIIVTVKTDAEGNWAYDLDKEFPDGEHEVYIAVTDNVGKITSQSQALPFVKTADAITVKPVSAAAAKNNVSPLERSRTELLITAIVIIISFVGIALVLIGRRSSFIR